MIRDAGGMMARMLTQAPLPWLPAGAAGSRPGVGVGPGRDRGGAGGGVWVFTVRAGRGRTGLRGEQDGATPAGQAAEVSAAGEDEPPAAAGRPVLPVLPDPVPRQAGRAAARFGLLGEGAAPVFAAGARCPLAGLLLALPALEQAGLLACARQVYGRLRNGGYGLASTLVMLVVLALPRDPRAAGATRTGIAAAGPVLGPERGPGVKPRPRQLGRRGRRGPERTLAK